LLILQQTPNNK